MLCQRVPSGSPARDEKGLERKLVTSDNFAKTRQISVSPRSWFIDTVGFPRGPPKSHLFLGESEKKEAYRYTTCGRRTEILVPRQIRFSFGPMKSGARQFSAPSPTSKVFGSNYFTTWRPRSFPRPPPRP